ncbi:MAG: hypothetical protein ABSC91_02330 [Candidatus Bathyarchaeia archaeon]|jgi:hypothetical protein
MKTRANLNLTLGFMLACSLFGSLITLLMVVYPPTTMQDYFWRKPLVGSTFLLICAWGSLTAVSPRKCSMAHETQMGRALMDSDVKTDFSVFSEGHHPDCGGFSAHIIRFRGTGYCAACTGLLAGGVIAMIVASLYFFFGLNAGPVSFPVVLVGQLGLVSGLIQFKLKSWTRSAANVLFVLGSSLMLIGVDQLVGSVFVDTYVIGLVILWILTRVMISQWDHRRICLSCGFSCATERRVRVLPSATQPVQRTDDD